MIAPMLVAALLFPPNDHDVASYCGAFATAARKLKLAIRSGGYGECVFVDHVGNSDVLLHKVSGKWKVLIAGGGAMGYQDYIIWGVPADPARDLLEKRAIAERAAQ